MQSGASGLVLRFGTPLDGLLMKTRPSFQRHAGAITLLTCAAAGFLAMYGALRFLGHEDDQELLGRQLPVAAEAAPAAATVPVETLEAVPVSTSQVTASRSSSPGDAQPTPQDATSSSWNLLPRNSRDFASMVIHGPLEARYLLRITQTNPRDTPIPVDQQEELGQYCAKAAAQLGTIDRLASSAAGTDLLQLVDQGRSRAKHIRDLDASLTPQEQQIVEKARLKASEQLAKILGKTPEEVRADPTFTAIVPELHFKDHTPLAYGNAGGIVHSATPQELPNASAAMEAKRWACFEIASQLCGFFAHHACLTAQEASSQMSSVVARLDRPPFGQAPK